MSITASGVYDLPAAEYHADPAPAPSLSASCARLLLDRSPLHVWWEHPRLNTMREPEPPSDAQECGAIVHTLFLGVGPEIVEVEADDWRTAKAREKREQARAEGKLPVLSWRLAELERCADAARAQIQAYPEIAALLSAGRAEQTVLWREGETWCRALVDWLPDDPRAPLLDLKTTSLSAAPQSWERRVIDRYALQAAFYTRGLAAVRGVRPEGMRFVVIELDPPHALSVLAPAPDLEALAERDVNEALALWSRCLATNHWPGYPTEIAWVEAPGWMQTRQEERALRNEFLRERKKRLDEGAIYQRLLAAERPLNATGDQRLNLLEDPLP
jgi:hypothetical protein